MVDEPTIESIPIDPEGRYIVVTNGLNEEQARQMRDAFLDWWENDEKILVLYSSPGIKFQVVRVNDDA